MRTLAIRCRWLCPLVLAFAGLAPAWAQDEERTLSAGGNTLEVTVVDVDDPARRAELQGWLAEVAAATLTAYGRYPLAQARVRIMQIDSDDDSPVPWGQTRRRGDAAVLLYVRRDASLSELRADWTAIHELSHLFHPYLGDDGRWLAEGLASYYQNVLRARAGLVAQDEAWRLLEAGFARGRRESSGTPLVELSRRHRGTMRVYWAGAAFWLEADIALRRDHRSSLDQVLSRYSTCCLRGVGEVPPQEFLASLDELSRSRVFSELYRRYADSRAFPPLEHAYRALAIEEDADGKLDFRDGRAAALRRSIMAPPASKPTAP
ncbi:hypothetical protein [Lysobacter panacisoli]|uniref:Peptidase M61 catalytic domain-containing protein n=1 Tax=Lysobacter panacisoli TaxID=1255263 RepID=A0ABP9KZ52_9GAMM|nr:hypothetical protein [Lysobacter panacisoli]